jgi:hypothetical protein
VQNIAIFGFGLGLIVTPPPLLTAIEAKSATEKTQTVFFCLPACLPDGLID